MVGTVNIDLGGMVLSLRARFEMAARSRPRRLSPSWNCSSSEPARYAWPPTMTTEYDGASSTGTAKMYWLTWHLYM